MPEPTPYDTAMSADPAADRWGFFSIDPWDGGAGVFLWFASAEDLLGTVREGEVALYLADDDAAADALRGRIDAALDALRGGSDPEAVLAGLDDVCAADVLWAGTLDGLMTGDHEWARGLRASFRGDGMEDGDAGPVAEDEHEAFIAFVREYVEG